MRLSDQWTSNEREKYEKLVSLRKEQLRVAFVIVIDKLRRTLMVPFPRR